MIIIKLRKLSVYSMVTFVTLWATGMKLCHETFTVSVLQLTSEYRLHPCTRGKKVQKRTQRGIILEYWDTQNVCYSHIWDSMLSFKYKTPAWILNPFPGQPGASAAFQRVCSFLWLSFSFLVSLCTGIWALVCLGLPFPMYFVCKFSKSVFLMASHLPLDICHPAL